jgi:ABC-2 type transport system ATP-binding protein
VLEIKNLIKTYPNGKQAVSNLTLTISDGDLCGIIGKNGAGKTTTIKACLDIHDYDSGDILLNGVSIKQFPTKCKKEMAYVPDSPALEPYLTGIQYLNFICDVYGVSSKETLIKDMSPDSPMDLVHIAGKKRRDTGGITRLFPEEMRQIGGEGAWHRFNQCFPNSRRERIEELASCFGMSDKLNDLISSYSHGMKQKLSLIGAFVHKPKLLILDEPFAGLDPEAFVELKRLMKELCLSGSSVLFSSHILDVVEKTCNKIAVIKDGKLILSGDTKDILGKHDLEDVFMELNEK